MMLEMSEVEFDMDQLQDLDWHCVLYHKQRTSARTRFLRIGRDVVHPEPIDDRSALSEGCGGGRVVLHPASGLATLSREYGIPMAELRIEHEPLAGIGDEGTPVWLVEVLTTDPPAEEVSASGGRFVSIMETRDVAHVQRELLRLAYERILG